MLRSVFSFDVRVISKSKKETSSGAINWVTHPSYLLSMCSVFLDCICRLGYMREVQCVPKLGGLEWGGQKSSKWLLISFSERRSGRLLSGLKFSWWSYGKGREGFWGSKSKQEDLCAAHK